MRLLKRITALFILGVLFAGTASGLVYATEAVSSFASLRDSAPASPALFPVAPNKNPYSGE